MKWSGAGTLPSPKSATATGNYSHIYCISSATPLHPLSIFASKPHELQNISQDKADIWEMFYIHVALLYSLTKLLSVLNGQKYISCMKNEHGKFYIKALCYYVYVLL